MYDFAMHLYIRIHYYVGSYYVLKGMQEWLQRIITGSMFTQLALLHLQKILQLDYS